MSDKNTTGLAKSNKTVAQGNFIVRSHLSFGAVEARIFTLMLAGIHKDDSDFKPIEIPMSSVTPHTGGTAYEMVENACKALMTKYIEASETDRKRGTKLYSFVDYLGIDKGTGVITGIWSQTIRPFLIQLKEHYTLAEVQHLMELKTGAAHRLYWLLKSYETLGVYEESMEELKNLLCGKEVKYDRLYDFKRFVLLPAFAEIQKTPESPENPLAFEYLEEKTGKKITSIKFIFDGTAKQLAAERKANKVKSKKKITNQGSLFPDTPPVKYKPSKVTIQGINKVLTHFTLEDLKSMSKFLDYEKLVQSYLDNGFTWNEDKTILSGYEREI
ncbi:replication initiation protein (plasmid) [Adhaeribacter swui]|uniref:Replication initiation protein n=1 Tax=Adhaeribacter swui TaxID=2086471 RepID=A0A7G7G2F3_9BACT|nr:replication initiation protein [Adhaeribacter swui]QNF31337.1 replication initiation protein [Adhaeribacter swui]